MTAVVRTAEKGVLRGKEKEKKGGGGEEGGGKKRLTKHAGRAGTATTGGQYDEGAGLIKREESTPRRDII